MLDFYPTLILLAGVPTGEGWPRNRCSSTHTSRPVSSRTSCFGRPTTSRHIPQAGNTRSTWALSTTLTLVRYDNSHEDTKGHEHHTAAGDLDDVEFPGMEDRLVEFWASADEYWDAVGGDPPRPH